MIPVAVNNLYGDPAMQLDNSIEKLQTLSTDPWVGPVGLITKGSFNFSAAQRVKESAPKNLVVLVSISSLVTGAEPVSVEKRLRTISSFASVGVPVIGYARPLTGTPEAAISLIDSMFSAGATTVVASGFRGTNDLAKNIGVHNPSISVKEMPAEISAALKNSSHRIFQRTSCGAAFALGLKRSWNPYWKSPQLAGCASCPLRATCFENPNVNPNKRGLAVLRALGYKCIPQGLSKEACCNIQASNRRSCTSCCTTCFKQRSGAFLLQREDGKKPNLGELSFARHILGGVQVYSPGVIDGGDPSVGNVNPPRKIGIFANKRIRALNTWLSYSNQISKCFGCKYCFAPYYSNDLGEYGCSPREIMDII